MAKIVLVTAVAWIATIFLDLLLIFVTAVALERASVSAAGIGVSVGFFLLGAVATAATSYVLLQTRTLSRVRRMLWVGGFGVLQLGTWGFATLMLMLVMNR